MTRNEAYSTGYSQACYGARGWAEPQLRIAIADYMRQSAEAARMGRPMLFEMCSGALDALVDALNERNIAAALRSRT